MLQKINNQIISLNFKILKHFWAAVRFVLNFNLCF